VKKLGVFAVKYRIPIIVVYVILLIPAAIGYFLTPNNYDILSYMPDDMNSKQGEQLLEEEFGLSGVGIIMVRGKELWEVQNLKKRIEEVEGVDSVMWVDDYTDIFVPIEFIEEDIRTQFISGDSVLLQVLFEENARSLQTNLASREIEDLIDDDTVFGGEPAIINELQVITEKDMVIYMIIAVATIYLILALSVSSYIEPLLFLISVGVAVIINMGTNIFMGEISFMTASIAAVMQLGISMDFSIFLLHRFEEEKEKYPSVLKAMETAVSKTAMTIASSALTTIGGFFALTVMQNGIGRDMGLVLGKGIIISLIVNLTFLPSLILVAYNFTSRFRHRILLPSFKSIARWIIKGRWVFVIILLALAVPAYLAQSKADYYYSNENYLPAHARSVQATNDIMDSFGAMDMAYLITRNEGRVKEKELVDRIKTVKGVDSVLGISEQVDMAIPEVFIPEDVIENFVAEDYRYFLIFLEKFDHETDVFITIDDIRSHASTLHDEYYVTGNSALTRDMASLVDTDARNVLYISVVLIFLIIAISFRSIAIPFILILAIQIAIWINVSFPYLQGQQVSSLTPMIIGAIQLGATVDYAILFASRYQENIFNFSRRIDAMRQTIEDTGRSILTSALTMFGATFGISLIASIKTTGEMTKMIGRGAIISMIVIFIGLPAMMLIMEKPLQLTTKGWPTMITKAKETVLPLD
jgi:predicted RND superfamily exporter protein